jgi:hypothetical protein
MKAECGNKWDSRMARVLKEIETRLSFRILKLGTSLPRDEELTRLNHEAGQNCALLVVLDV